MANHRAPLPYRLAKVYIGPKESFVEYYYWDLGADKYVRDKVRLGIKKLSDQEKRSQLQQLCSKLNALLKERNNKGIYHEVKKQSSNTGPVARLNVVEALDYVRNSGDEDLSTDRITALKDTAATWLKFLKAYAALESVRIENTNDEVLKIFRKWCKSENRAGKTINKYLSAIQFASQWLKRKGIIDRVTETAHLRVSMPKNETGRFPPLTEAEKIRVFSYWKERDPYFHHFLFWAYYSAVRGAELYRLQRKDLNFDSKTIYCSWFKTKNGLSNYVQMLQPLCDLMLQLGIDKLDGESYIFGLNFKPSKKKYSGEQSSMRWAYHRDKMELGIDKQLYGLKHTFNVDYIEQNKNNINWEWLRRHNRHATIQQTQQYISGLTAYFLDETQSVIKNYL